MLPNKGPSIHSGDMGMESILPPTQRDGDGEHFPSYSLKHSRYLCIYAFLNSILRSTRSHFLFLSLSIYLPLSSSRPALDRGSLFACVRSCIVQHILCRRMTLVVTDLSTRDHLSTRTVGLGAVPFKLQWFRVICTYFLLHHPCSYNPPCS